MTEKQTSFVTTKLGEIKDPELRKSMEGIYRKQKTVASSTPGLVEKHREGMEKDVQEKSKQPAQLSLGLLPTDITRVSPFRPIRRSDMRSSDVGEARRFPQPSDTTEKYSWGYVIVFGPDLGIREESLLIELLVRWVENSCKDFECGYHNLLESLGYKRNPKSHRFASVAYNTLKESVSRLDRSRFELYVKQGEQGKFKKHAVQFADLDWDDKRQKLIVHIDPWFVFKIAGGYVSGVNLKERQGIRGDLSKALHRFISSHRSDTQFMGINKLALTLGMNIKQPEKQITDQVRKAVKELKDIGFLTKRTKIRTNKLTKKKEPCLTWYRSGPVLGGKPLVEHIKKQKRDG